MLHWRLDATHFERQTRSRRSRDIRRSSLLGAHAARGMGNCLETPKTRCFTGDLTQRTLSGRPVQHDIRRSSLLGHMPPAAWVTQHDMRILENTAKDLVLTRSFSGTARQGDSMCSSVRIQQSEMPTCNATPSLRAESGVFFCWTERSNPSLRLRLLRPKGCFAIVHPAPRNDCCMMISPTATWLRPERTLGGGVS